MQDIVSKTWQISGVFGKITAGILVFKKGQVAFITEDGIQFNVPIASVTNIKWPFLRMGLGFDAVVDGKKFKFSFSRPNTFCPEINIIAANPLPRVNSAGYINDALSPLQHLKEDKATTKKWKEILSLNNPNS